jgi:hypothetical protein
MKVYTKEKRNKLSTAWLGFDGDRLYRASASAFQTSDRVSKKVCLDGNLFIEEYIDKRSYFIIVYLSCSLGCLTEVNELLNSNCTQNRNQCFWFGLHLRMGSTVMLKTIGAEGAGGYGSGA